MAVNKRTMYTTAEVAERWGIPVGKVRYFIATHQLEAVNFSRSNDGERPRYRIPITAVIDFEEGRRVEKPKPPTTTRRRRRKTSKKRNRA
jgi:electron transfer flavoprotein alpha/beta subunit